MLEMISDLTLKTSFYVSYVLLLTTGTITFIEALANKDPTIRHIMNLETCISLIAGYFYSTFLTKIESDHVDYASITLTRYTDWFMSTPFMLLVLCIFLSYGTEHKKLHLRTYVLVLLADFAMLYTGYMAETKRISKPVGFWLGFLFFGIMFGLIYYDFMRVKQPLVAVVVYFVFVALWSIYGIAYLMDEKTKNLMYNTLDVSAKCFVGVFLWLYFTETVDI